MERDAKIVVFGAGGLIGAELVKCLKEAEYDCVIECRHKDLELTNQIAVNNYFEKERPEYIFLCAIRTITNFEGERNIDAIELYSNLMMHLNVMEAARIYGVEKAVFIGSAMLYPWNNEHDKELLREEFLEAFSINQYRTSMQSSVLSKYACMKMCQYYNKQYDTKYVYTIPTHIYGNLQGRKNLYFLENLVIELCDAKLKAKESIRLDIFGEGKAQKQILHVHDCAKALITIINQYTDYTKPINIGALEKESWSTVVEKICRIIDYHGTVYFNTERKERMENRICDTSKLTNLGWNQEISMEDGLRKLCEEYMRMKRS